MEDLERLMETTLKIDAEDSLSESRRLVDRARRKQEARKNMIPKPLDSPFGLPTPASSAPPTTHSPTTTADLGERQVERLEQPARRREVHRGDALERRREPAELARERRLRGGGGGDEDERVARGGEREVRRRARRVQDRRGRRLRRRERATVSGVRARKLRGEGGGCLRERREAVQLERWELWRWRLHERSE